MTFKIDDKRADGQSFGFIISRYLDLILTFIKALHVYVYYTD